MQRSPVSQQSDHSVYTLQPASSGERARFAQPGGQNVNNVNRSTHTTRGNNLLSTTGEPYTVSGTYSQRLGHIHRFSSDILPILIYTLILTQQGQRVNLVKTLELGQVNILENVRYISYSFVLHTHSS